MCISRFPILQEMGERGVWAKRMLESHYRQVDPLKGLLEGGDFRPIEKTKGQINPPAGRSKRYILGYTGISRQFILLLEFILI